MSRNLEVAPEDLRGRDNRRSFPMIKKIIRRFLIPRPLICLYYFLKQRTKISPHAEVELSPNLSFGPGCTVSSFTKIKASDGPLIVGARCGFATGCFISAGEKGIIVGDNLICGPNVTIVSSNYVYEKLSVHMEDQGSSSKGVRIGSNVWLGAGTVVLDGSVLGDNTIVVANSLINRRYPPNTILQGNPAKIMMKRIAYE